MKKTLLFTLLALLPLEIERLDRVFLSQFQVETCVELRNPSSERVETGKECDSQVTRPWFPSGLV